MWCSFSLVQSIVKLLIDIIFMSAVSDSSGPKQYPIAPWASGISRAQISMFIMATLVYFLVADIFHSCALKEMKALWQRGSRTAILRRFYRSCSMNTLISLGTTIAYVSPVAQLIAAGVNRLLQINNSNYYFDSVVFLTLFFLVGRLIDSFSKARTSDAVEMLGNLRPTTAIQVEVQWNRKGKDSVVQTGFPASGRNCPFFLVWRRHTHSPPHFALRKHNTTNPTTTPSPIAIQKFLLNVSPAMLR
ncbi:hypothetical protein K469DRAFT_749958 [Zopfia rhizophila CBS 207.26]|uniref:Uncharacterized protein n=1 Tax=Zopfia rhizophila CBS 207.26 TaxID=1314779 RepID=A0A6A6E5F8_9PEZI|nr:hypothetical protein K469DRAFT_749958 [Zopfia rhizophila CBS 207.26]